MRLIDADALKKEYRMADRCEDCARNSRDCQNVYSWTLMDVCSMLDEAPTIGGWISVKDRLPESIINKVLVWLEHDDLVGYIGFGHYEKYNGQEIWFDLEHSEAFSVRGYTVTHWMPLPELPEEDATSGNH